MNFRYYKPERLIIFVCALTLIFGYVSTLFEKWIDTFVSTNTNDLIKSLVDLTGVISTIGLITLVLTYLNYFGWKSRCFSWLIDIPDMNGRYSGSLESSFQDYDKKSIIKDCILEINQTASFIYVSSFYGGVNVSELTSTSKSVIGEIVKDNDGFFSIIFTYENKPNTLSHELHSHYGTTVLRYYPDIKTLDGDYYNDRMNRGNIKVQFQQKKRLGRFS